jgi:hypothetical protein
VAQSVAVQSTHIERPQAVADSVPWHCPIELQQVSLHRLVGEQLVPQTWPVPESSSSHAWFPPQPRAQLKPVQGPEPATRQAQVLSGLHAVVSSWQPPHSPPGGPQTQSSPKLSHSLP